MHPSSRIGPHKRSNGTKTINGTDRTDSFHFFFHSVFIPDESYSPPLPPYTDKVMPTPIFSISDNRKSLSATNSSISSGPDGISPLLLKKYPELCSPICDLFHMSLQQSCVPKACKTARIVPIYKSKGSTLKVNNWSPWGKNFSSPQKRIWDIGKNIHWKCKLNHNIGYKCSTFISFISKNLFFLVY